MIESPSLYDIYGEQAREQDITNELQFVDAAYEDLRRAAETQALESLKSYKPELTTAEFEGIGRSITAYRELYLHEQDS